MALGPFKYTLPVAGTSLVALAWAGATMTSIASGLSPMIAFATAAYNGLSATFVPIADLAVYAYDAAVHT